MVEIGLKKNTEEPQTNEANIDIEFHGKMPKGIKWEMTVDDIKEVYGEENFSVVQNNGYKELTYKLSNENIVFTISNQDGLNKIVYEKYGEFNDEKLVTDYIDRFTELRELYSDAMATGFGSSWGERVPNIEGYDKRAERADQVTKGKRKLSDLFPMDGEYNIIDFYPSFNGRYGDPYEYNVMQYYDVDVKVVLRETISKGTKNEYSGETWLVNDTPNPIITAEINKATEINAGINFKPITTDQLDISSTRPSVDYFIEIDESLLPSSVQGFNRISIIAYGSNVDRTTYEKLVNAWISLKLMAVPYDFQEEYKVNTSEDRIIFVALFKDEKVVGYTIK